MVWLYDRTRSVLMVMLTHLPIVVGAYVFMDEGLSAHEAFSRSSPTARRCGPSWGWSLRRAGDG
jgi:hypothetical protein